MVPPVSTKASQRQKVTDWSRCFTQSKDSQKRDHIYTLAWVLSWQRICLQCGKPGFDPWVGKKPWKMERLPTPVFWSEEFHGLYSPWVTKSQPPLSNFHFHLQNLALFDCIHQEVQRQAVSMKVMTGRGWADIFHISIDVQKLLSTFPMLECFHLSKEAHQKRPSCWERLKAKGEEGGSG